MNVRRKSMIRSFDAFCKVENSLTVSTSMGGFVSILISILVLLLTFSEIYEWRRSRINYEFLVDQTLSVDFDVNIDVTVAMNCMYLRMDMRDVSGSDTNLMNYITPINTKFNTKNANPFSETLVFSEKASDILKKLKDVLIVNNEGCRFKGSFPIKKVRGMIFITAVGHGYMGMHTPHSMINFTHRFDSLSFGNHYPGIVNPLDETFIIANSNFENFQYFLGIVPTIYVDETANFYGGVVITNQYAVTEFSHNIDPERPDSMMGIFLKYDLEPMSIRITKTRRGTIEFLTRSFGLIGGVMATSGIILNIYLTTSKYFRSAKYSKVSNSE